MDVDVARNTVKVRDSEVILDMLPVTIGRGAEASIQVRDRWASRLNCEIGEVDGTLFGFLEAFSGRGGFPAVSAGREC